METISLYLFYGVRFLALIGFIFFFIYIHAKLRQKKLDFSYLFQGILGSIILISLCNALYKSGGLTVLGIFIPLLIYYGYLNPKQAKERISVSKISINFFWGLLPLLFFFFSWSFFCLINFTDQIYYLPSGLATQANDFFIYAQRAQFLGETGQENYFGLLNQLDIKYQGLTPYHYLELWLGNACSQLLGISHVYSLGLIIKPLFYLASATGLLAIIEYLHEKVRPIHVALGIALFFVSGLYIKSSLLNLGEFNLSMLSYRFKMISYYPFIIGFVLMMLQRKEKKAFVFLAALMLSSVVVVPALLGGSILYLLYQKGWKKKASFAPLVLLLLTSLSIGAFYLLTPSPSLQSSLGLEREELWSVFSISNIPSIFLSFFSHIGNILVVFFSSFALIFWGWKRKTLLNQAGQDLLLYLAAVIIAGAFSYALLKDFENAIQLFFNPTIAILNVGAIYLVILIIKKQEYRKWVWLFLGVSIANQVYILGPKIFKHHITPVYSAEYLHKIEEFARNNKLSAIGGVLKEEQDYTSSFSKITYAYTGAYYLLYFSGEISTLSLSDHKVPISSKDKRNNLVNRNSGYFYQYVDEQRKKNEFRSMAESQLSFIKKYKINFLVCSKNVTLSPDFDLLIKDKIEDSLSGEFFILLQNP